MTETDYEAPFEPALSWWERHPGFFGRDNFYSKLRNGVIPAVRVGGRYFVRRDWLERRERQQEETAENPQ